MYAGKTTELLKRVLWAQQGQKKRVLVVKPAFDDRFSTTKIVSHDGLSVDAKSVTTWDQVALEAADSEIVFVDEIQFFQEPHFKGNIIEHIRDCLITGADVVVTGLDMDWQGEPFLKTALLAGMADSTIKLKANCTRCGQPAAKTHKKVPDGEQIELGAADKYEARCNDHWGM
jgi:thymidine kinase